MIPKKYRPGQLITINHKIYRLAKVPESEFLINRICAHCAFDNEPNICMCDIPTEVEDAICLNLKSDLVFKCINQDN